MSRLTLALVATMVIAVACGPSTTPWADFQSRALDTADAINASPDFASDPAFRQRIANEASWVKDAKAEACYDPAFRAYRELINDLGTYYRKIPTGISLADIPGADLDAAIDALKAAINDEDRVGRLLLVASGNYK